MYNIYIEKNCLFFFYFACYTHVLYIQECPFFAAFNLFAHSPHSNRLSTQDPSNDDDNRLNCFSGRRKGRMITFIFLYVVHENNNNIIIHNIRVILYFISYYLLYNKHKNEKVSTRKKAAIPVKNKRRSAKKARNKKRLFLFKYTSI